MVLRCKSPTRCLLGFNDTQILGISSSYYAHVTTIFKTSHGRTIIVNCDVCSEWCDIDEARWVFGDKIAQPSCDFGYFGVEMNVSFWQLPWGQWVQVKLLSII